jgi:hypothetical protein
MIASVGLRARYLFGYVVEAANAKAQETWKVVDEQDNQKTIHAVN